MSLVQTPPTRPASTRLSAGDIAGVLGLPSPTHEQTAIIEAPHQSMLVVAGAGSGKTETMAARVVWLVANHVVAPADVLGLTFTRKASSELTARVGVRLRALVDAGIWTPPLDEDTGNEVLGGLPTVSTYHAYAGRLVREHGVRLGIEPESRLLSPAAAWQVAAEAVARFDGPMTDMDYTEGSVIRAVVDLAGEMAEHLLEPADVEGFLDRFIDEVEAIPPGQTRKTRHPLREVLVALRARRLVIPIVSEYLALKRRRDSVDYGDQMAAAARLARDVDAVARGERARFKAVLLDEFQDTSEAQLVLLRSLFAAVGGDRGAVVPVTAVGDPHQSIYGWRGASATTLARFPAEFGCDGSPTPVLPLTTSWRNDQRVLDAAEVAARPLRQAQVVAVPLLTARPDAGPGHVSLGMFESIDDEADAVARLVAQAWRRPSGRRTGATAAVVCRKRSQFPLLVAALQQHDLPVEVVGVGGLLFTPEVADLVAMLWVVHDPSRGDHLMRLLTGPLVRLGAADLDGLYEWARLRQRPSALAPVSDGTSQTVAVDREVASREVVSLVEVLDDLPPLAWRGAAGQRVSAVARDRLHDLRAIVRRLRGLASLPLADLVVEVERGLGLDIEVAVAARHTAATARVHLDAFTDVAASFSVSSDRPTLGAFLAWLDAAEDEERGLDLPSIETNDDAVAVLTVHAAKGLEWDVVAVPGLVEGGLPAGSSTRFDPEQQQWVPGPDNDNGWTTRLHGVPFALRGDRDGLARLDLDQVQGWDDVEGRYASFRAQAGGHEIAEERRLVYVAATRARHSLVLTGAVWHDGVAPRIASRFLTEIRDAMPDGELAWHEPPTTAKAPNPRPVLTASWTWPTASPETATHPSPPSPSDHQPSLTLRGADRAAEAVWSTDAHTGAGSELMERAAMLVRDWRRRTKPPAVSVQLPTHLSVSDLQALASDRDRFAASLRRPMPRPPAREARRGSAFHAWIEQHFAFASILDVDDLPGSADSLEEPGQASGDLPAMKELFLASEWATRVPLGIEVPIETAIAGYAVRGRIDAVFAIEDSGQREHGPGVVIVDWKTGSPPSGRAAEIAALQLGAYRLAYARLRGLDPTRVGAAFYYASLGRTVYPRLPDEDDLASVLRLA